MKHILLPLFAMLVLPLAADELKINGNFKGSMPESKLPVGWYSNNSSGSSAVKVINDTVGLALNIRASARENQSVFFGKMFDVAPGSLVEISADLKGKGTFRFGCIGYTAQGKFLRTITGFRFPLTKNYQKVTNAIRITPLSNEKLQKIRIVLIAERNAEVTLKDVKAEMEGFSQKEEKLSVNGGFYGAGDTNMPAGWQKSGGPAKITVSGEKDDIILSIKATGKQSAFFDYNFERYAVADGSTLNFEADICGKGPIRFGYYGYSKTDKYVRTCVSPVIMPANQFKRIKSSVRISGTDTQKVERIMVIIMAPSGADFQIKDLKVKVTPAK